MVCVLGHPYSSMVVQPCEAPLLQRQLVKLRSCAQAHSHSGRSSPWLRVARQIATVPCVDRTLLRARLDVLKTLESRSLLTRAADARWLSSRSAKSQALRRHIPAPDTAVAARWWIIQAAVASSLTQCQGVGPDVPCFLPNSLHLHAKG